MGAPAFVPGLLHLMPGVWKQLTAVAHTLPYDTHLVEEFQAGRPLPAGQWAAITIPALVMCGTAKDTPGHAAPRRDRRRRRAAQQRLMVRRGLGHTKKLNAKVIAATITGFLTGPQATRPPRPRAAAGTPQPHTNRSTPWMTRSKARPTTSRPSRRNTDSRSATGLSLINSSEETKHKALVDWLKAGYGIGHGHATALVGHALAQQRAAGPGT